MLIFYFNSSYCLAFSGVSGVCLDCCNPGIALLFLFFCCCCCFLLSFSSCLKFISSCSCMFLPPSHLSVSVYCSARVFLTLFLVTAFWLFPDFSCVLFHFLLPVCPIVSLVLITHGPIPSFFKTVTHQSVCCLGFFFLLFLLPWSSVFLSLTSCSLCQFGF